MAVDVQGDCDERFSEVADEFSRNFAERGEVGASVAVTVGGETVVDLWGGHLDAGRTRQWDKDTLCVIMSCTKGAVSLCAHLLASTGELEFDERVATYWPEFAAAGKHDVLVHHLMTHQVGLPGLRDPVKPGGFYDWDYMVERLAAEAPLWEPGTRHGYHGLTWGFLIGEVIRRITGRSVGMFFAEEVARPLDLELWIGLPESELGRVATFLPPAPPAEGEAISRMTMLAMTDPASLPALMMVNTGGYLVPGEWDSPAALTSELPSSGGVGNARALATMYRAIVHERTIGRFTIGPEDLARMGAVQSAVSEDPVLFTNGRWALGFHKGSATARSVVPPARVILSEPAFGHTGFGGSIGFAEPEADMSFAYVMNQMRGDQGLAESGQSLVDAVYRALGYRRTKYDIWVR